MCSSVLDITLRTLSTNESKCLSFANNKVDGDVKDDNKAVDLQCQLYKFLKNSTEIQTIHAFALWHYFGMNFMHNVHCKKHTGLECAIRLVIEKRQLALS
jgi:hypothetical protein